GGAWRGENATRQAAYYRERVALGGGRRGGSCPRGLGHEGAPPPRAGELATRRHGNDRRDRTRPHACRRAAHGTRLRIATGDATWQGCRGSVARGVARDAHAAREHASTRRDCRRG